MKTSRLVLLTLFEFMALSFGCAVTRAATVVIDSRHQLVVTAHDLRLLKDQLERNRIVPADDSETSQLVRTPSEDIELHSKTVVQHIANVLAHIECRLYACGGHPCIGFKSFDALQVKADHGPGVVQRTLIWDGSRVQIGTPVLTREAPTEHSGAGFYFNTITCTDEERQLGGIPNDRVEVFTVAGIGLSVAEHAGEGPTACSGEYDPSWAGWLDRIRKSNAYVNLATSYGVQIMAPIAAAYVVAPQYAFPVQAAVSTAVGIFGGSPLGVSEHQSRREAWTRVAPQFMPEQTRKRLQLEKQVAELKAEFIRKKAEIYEPNRIPLQEMFEKLETDLEKQKQEEQAQSKSQVITLGEQKSPIQVIETRIRVLKSVLSMPTAPREVERAETLRRLEEFYRDHFYEDEFSDEFTRLVLRIQENSEGIPVETKGIYILGKPGTGKSTILKGIREIFPDLPMIEISMSGKKFEDFLIELDTRLTQSKVDNPIVLIDEAGDMLGGKMSGSGGPFSPPVDPVSTFKSYTGNTEESKIPSAGLKKAWLSGNSFGEGVEVYHDASRIMWVLTGNHPIQDSGLARRFPTTAMKRVPRDIRSRIANIFLEKNRIRESDLSSGQRDKYQEILEYDQNHNDGVAILENVITAFAAWLRNQGVSLFKQEQRFDVEATFKKYVVSDGSTPETPLTAFDHPTSEGKR